MGNNQKVVRSVLSMTLPSFLVSVASGYGWESEVGLIQGDGGVNINFGRPEMQEPLVIRVEASGSVSTCFFTLIDGVLTWRKRATTIDDVLSSLSAPPPSKSSNHEKKGS
jgi:hypothetical protein